MALRVIYDNAADRAATLVASSTAGSLVASNLQTDIKSAVWRSTATTATITATFSAYEMVAGVVLPFCNFTSAATMRVRGYTEIADASPSFDTGAILACPVANLGMWSWGATMGVNAYAYGGGTYGRIWPTDPHAIKKVVIDIVDSTNPSGYIEVGRLVCGNYWSPEINTEYGSTSVSVQDTSKQFRNDAGDLMSDRGTKHKKQTLSLGAMAAADREQLWNILLGNGMSRPILFSLYPNGSDNQLEQIHQMYCKLAVAPDMHIPYFDRYASSLTLEEV